MAYIHKPFRGQGLGSKNFANDHSETANRSNQDSHVPLARWILVWLTCRYSPGQRLMNSCHTKPNLLTNPEPCRVDETSKRQTHRLGPGAQKNAAPVLEPTVISVQSRSRATYSIDAGCASLTRSLLVFCTLVFREGHWAYSGTERTPVLSLRYVGELVVNG